MIAPPMSSPVAADTRARRRCMPRTGSERPFASTSRSKAKPKGDRKQAYAKLPHYLGLVAQKAAAEREGLASPDHL
jgi:hypothetical protein